MAQHLKVTIDLYSTRETPRGAVLQLADAILEQSDWLEPDKADIPDWHIRLRAINARIHFERFNGERPIQPDEEWSLFPRSECD